MLISRRTLLGTALALTTTPMAARIAPTATVLASDAGARGDGRTDDRAALQAALNSGRMLDGRNGTFAIAGNLSVGPLFAGMANLTLLQLNPAANTTRTLMIEGAAGFSIENITVLRGGTGAEHPDKSEINDNHGIFIHQCRNFYMAGVSVSGGGIGTGLVIYDSSDFELDGCKAHDMRWLLDRMPTDDAIQGMLFGRCRRFVVRRPMASNIGGTAAGVMTHDQNRGIAVTSCSDFTISDADVSNVGQGLDVSGDGGNLRFKILRGQISDVATWGYKFANSAQAGQIIDAVATRCGIGGFVASGPAEPGIATPTRDLVFERCAAREMNSVYPSSRSFGFGVLKQLPTPVPTPSTIVFRNCTASAQPGGRMLYGFDNEVPAISDPAFRNRVENCTANGFQIAATRGF